MLYLGLMWDHRLALCEVPSSDLTDDEVAELLRAYPFHLQMTIRQVMIAVAFLSITFGASLDSFRSRYAESFRYRARFHALEEAKFRESELRWIQSDIEMERGGFGRGHFSDEAAKSAAWANYHAAMRRKYEQAASRPAFSVEPDPPYPGRKGSGASGE
jgi:hypothetical protein